MHTAVVEMGIWNGLGTSLFMIGIWNELRTSLFLMGSYKITKNYTFIVNQNNICSVLTFEFFFGQKNYVTSETLKLMFEGGRCFKGKLPNEVSSFSIQSSNVVHFGKESSNNVHEVCLKATTTKNRIKMNFSIFELDN